MTAQQLFDEAFAAHKLRTPRSAAYKAGVLTALESKLKETRTALPYYTPGTAECDAYFAGQDEGNLIAFTFKNAKELA